MPYRTKPRARWAIPEALSRVDETFVGGKVSNMHKGRRIELQKLKDAVMRPDHYMGKTIVMGFLDRKERRVRATIIPARETRMYCKSRF